MKTFTKGFETFSFFISLVCRSWVKFYDLGLETNVSFFDRIFLIKTWSNGFAATLWLRGTTHTDSRDVQDKGSACFCNPLLVKSSTANNTPPTWLHLPFPANPSLAGHVYAAHDISH